MAIKWKWGVSYKYVAGMTHAQIIETIGNAGFCSLEADDSYANGRSDAELIALRQQYEAGGIWISSLHLPFNVGDDVAGFYEVQRQQAVKRHTELITAAGLLGSRLVVLHPGLNGNSVEVEGFETYLGALSKSLETLLPHAEKCGVLIALENLLPGKSHRRFGALPEHFTAFRKAFDHPALIFCLDTGHAQASYGHLGGVAPFIETMGERLGAFHLQDNPGDRDLHLAPGRGLVDWKPVFAKMRAMNYAYPACIEAPPFACGANNTYSPEAWRALAQECDQLAARCASSENAAD